jgi:hypothetical protein
VTSPHISWLKHGSHAEVGSVVVGRVALDGDLWTWQASLPHGDLLADHGGCETVRQALLEGGLNRVIMTASL